MSLVTVLAASSRNAHQRGNPEGEEERFGGFGDGNNISG